MVRRVDVSSEECVEKLKAKYETILDDIKEKRNEEKEKNFLKN